MPINRVYYMQRGCEMSHRYVAGQTAHRQPIRCNTLAEHENMRRRIGASRWVLRHAAAIEEKSQGSARIAAAAEPIRCTQRRAEMDYQGYIRSAIRASRRQIKEETRVG